MTERFLALSGNCAVTRRIVPPLARFGRVTSECNSADSRVVRDRTITSGLPPGPGRCRASGPLSGPARRGSAPPADTANQLAMMIIAGAVKPHPDCREYAPENRSVSAEPVSGPRFSHIEYPLHRAGPRRASVPWRHLGVAIEEDSAFAQRGGPTYHLPLRIRSRGGSLTGVDYPNMRARTWPA